MDKSDLDTWTKRVSEQEMPALSTTAQEISRIAEDESRPLSTLSDIILKDAAMTMHVLRLTDSAYHIPRKNRMNTINRALVMLGFDEVRSLCLSVGVFDPLVKGDRHDQLKKEMARAFHAATQAQSIAVQYGDKSSQEVFIATLLYHLGDMVFWAFGGKDADALNEEMQKTGCTKEEAELKVLGFRLKDLTLALSKKWGLGKLLEEAVSGSEPENPRSQAINLSHEFVRVAEKGWNTEEATALAEKMSDIAGVSPDAFLPVLKGNIQEAISTAERYGAHAAGDELARLVEPQDEEEIERALEEEARATSADVFPEPDPMFQLQILRDISVMILQEDATVSDVLELILDGIYHGIGVDRALFALLSPNRKYLRAKTAYGIGQLSLCRHFKFEMDADAPTVFEAVIEGQKPIWVSDRHRPDFTDLVPERISKVIGASPFFIAPTIVDGQPIGIFFADRHESNRLLDSESFEAFKQFALQANLALEHLGKY